MGNCRSGAVELPRAVPLPYGCLEESVRPDVLIDAEQVRWIVLPLERHEPVVLRRTVSRSNPIAPLGAEVVQVHAARSERTHYVARASCPRNVRVRRGGVGPATDDRQVEQPMALGIRGLVRGNA